MMRIVKDEHNRQKSLNASLQNELDALRNGSEASSRTRIVNGRMTPMSDDSHETSTRSQLLEMQRQLHSATSESADLQKKAKSLQSEVDELHEALNGARKEVDQLEREMDRLEIALQAAHKTPIHEENAELKRENELLQQRIGLLLEMDQPGNLRSNHRLSGHPDSRASSIKDQAFDALSSELDDWLATSSSSRPLSGYVPQRSASVARVERT
jgi:chromosome segregation ATPase